MNNGFSNLVSDVIIKTIQRNIENIVEPHIEKNRGKVEMEIPVSLVQSHLLMEYVNAGVMSFEDLQKKYALTFAAYVRHRYDYIESSARYAPDRNCVVVSMSWREHFKREFQEVEIDLRSVARK